MISSLLAPVRAFWRRSREAILFWLSWRGGDVGWTRARVAGDEIEKFVSDAVEAREQAAKRVVRQLFALAGGSSGGAALRVRLEGDNEVAIRVLRQRCGAKLPDEGSVTERPLDLVYFERRGPDMESQMAPTAGRRRRLHRVARSHLLGADPTRWHLLQTRTSSRGQRNHPLR